MFVKIFNKFPIFILIMTLTFNVSAEMPGMSGEIRRDYTDTSFGRVHFWTIGDGPAYCYSISQAKLQQNI